MVHRHVTTRLLEGLQIPVVSRAHLIRNKKAPGVDYHPFRKHTANVE